MFKKFSEFLTGAQLFYGSRKTFQKKAL